LIFVDTSFWIGLMVRQDDRHDEATTLLEQHGDQSLVTSNHVRGESWTFLGRRYGYRAAVAFLDRVERTAKLRVAFVPEEVEAEALRWLRRHDEREYSFVDATSFALMRSMRIKRALAFDGDFAAAGFTELRSA
jgi:uncharacterized protein